MEHTFELSRQSDTGLIRQYVQAGSAEAFGILADRYAGLVYTTCWRRLRHRELAEDATSAVFLLLADKAPHLQSVHNLLGWLYQTSLNTCKYMARQIKRSQPIDEAETRVSYDTAKSLNQSLMIDVALQRLPMADREAILLRYFQGMSLQEVADQQGGTEDAARMRVNRALNRLKAFLALCLVPLSQEDLAQRLGSGRMQASPDLIARVTAVHAVKPEVMLIAQGVKGAVRDRRRSLLIAGLAGLLLLGGGSTYVFAHRNTPKREAEEVTSPVTASEANAKVLPTGVAGEYKIYDKSGKLIAQVKATNGTSSVKLEAAESSAKHEAEQAAQRNSGPGQR